jgi:hypothetical protein
MNTSTDITSQLPSIVQAIGSLVKIRLEKGIVEPITYTKNFSSTTQFSLFKVTIQNTIDIDSIKNAVLASYEIHYIYRNNMSNLTDTDVINAISPIISSIITTTGGTVNQELSSNVEPPNVEITDRGLILVSGNIVFY